MTAMSEGQREKRLASALGELAAPPVRVVSATDVLHTLTEHCVDLLDVSASGALLDVPHGRGAEVVASDEHTRALELFGLEWDEGPCMDCCRSPRTRISETRLDAGDACPRWPRFTPRALLLGFTSVATVPLRYQDTVVGALSLLHDRQRPLDEGELRLARALADSAAVCVIQQQVVHEQRTQIARIQNSLDSRIVIEQAKGYLSNSRGCTADQAYTRMRTYARNRQLKLSDVAHQVLNGQAGATLLDPER
ncbi:transcriptional regulator [Streptomyces longisporoflavus]|uniref:GAF and ANTAR domain-containing protein n=1 Tax=Streptomyces longisporoflavus TaxID=28044 RepID=UPI0019A621C5|nr:GAF and ANTAR domain-containing protein [Streptomyces longisporoflavus]GGV67762.1 transcriptional regulator [Streptomyces longisporoflavus]